MKLRKRPVEVEGIRWTGKNTGEVKAWMHTQLLANPALMEEHGPISTFIKRRGAHMTKTLWENVLPDAKDEVTAAIWAHHHDAYLGIADGEWILIDRFGFYPCPAGEDGVAANYEVVVPEPTRQDESTEESEGKRCLHYACDQRQPEGPVNLWWADYGTCTRAHAVEYYGEEAID